jgi:hypothetical protein
MQTTGSSRAWLIHLAAGMALGAVIVLVVWISAGGRPFGRIIGEPDVSAPTSAAIPRAAGGDRAEAPTKGSARLIARPPALKGQSELEFAKPKAKAAKRSARKLRTAQPRRARRKARSRRTPVIRVVSPPPAETDESLDTPVAAVPESGAAPEPAPAPAPSGGGGGAAPKAPSYVTGAGEG